MFVLASTIAGIAGGAVAIFFWKGARYAIGAWGGFAFALWIQCFQSGGLIKSIGFRWILYIGPFLSSFPSSSFFLSFSFHRLWSCWFRSFHDPKGVSSFQTCSLNLTMPIEIHYHVLLVSTAFAGATSFMLGVDCFTTAGLKEVFPSSSSSLFFHSSPPSFMCGTLAFLPSSQNSSRTIFSSLYHKLCRSNSVSPAQ